MAEVEQGGVIGLAMAGKRAIQEDKPASRRPFTHELYTLQIDPAWQRQGIGRRLVTQIATMIKQEGATHLLVKVLADNPNIPFYERVGAVYLGSNPFAWAGYQTEELIYGWHNIE